MTTATLDWQTATTWPSCAPSRVDRTHIWLCGALLVGLLLRVHCLIFPYLWLDEYVTLWSIGGGTYSEMLERSTQWTASGPLFVLCYRACCDLVQNLEWGLKLPGVISGTVAIWVTWWASFKIFAEKEVSLVAAWLVALAPQFIHFSQEARPYMIGALLLLGATGFLAAWMQSGRRIELFAVVALSLIAVGFHLICALALLAQNLIVFCSALHRGWHKRRWLEWGVAQLSVAVVLWFSAGQLRVLNHRHGSMILETALPMPTRLSLDDGLWGQLQVDSTMLLIGIAFWFFARKFPGTDLAKAWKQHGGSVCMAAATFWVPSGVLTLLCALRVLDGWPRYYFLFQSGIVLALSWLVAGAFPKNLSRVLLTVVLVGSMTKFNCVNGVPSCRLNNAWKEFPLAEKTLQQRLGKNDLVLSRSGLIESNHLSFLLDPVGASYLKSFCEARCGALTAEHLPLPFSAESADTQQYLDALFREKVLPRSDFWLANIGTSDFDYNQWIASRFGSTMRKEEELVYPMITLTHYINQP